GLGLLDEDWLADDCHQHQGAYPASHHLELHHEPLSNGRISWPSGGGIGRRVLTAFQESSVRVEKYIARASAPSFPKAPSEPANLHERHARGAAAWTPFQPRIA